MRRTTWTAVATAFLYRFLRCYVHHLWNHCGDDRSRWPSERLGDFEVAVSDVENIDLDTSSSSLGSKEEEFVSLQVVAGQNKSEAAHQTGPMVDT